MAKKKPPPRKKQPKLSKEQLQEQINNVSQQIEYCSYEEPKKLQDLSNQREKLQDQMNKIVASEKKKQR